MIVDLMQREYTPEDLLNMPDGKHFELVNGRLVERHRSVPTLDADEHMGFLSDRIAGRLFQRLANFCDEYPLGWALLPNSGGFQGFPGSPRLVRKPDVAFVRFGRFPEEQLPPGHTRLAPEVVSPNDTYEEVDEKIEEYLRAGVRLVWIISPHNHTVRVYRLNGSSTSLRDNDELDGEDVLPGFRYPVRDLFPQPQTTTGGNGATPTT